MGKCMTCGEQFDPVHEDEEICNPCQIEYYMDDIEIEEMPQMEYEEE